MNKTVGLQLVVFSLLLAGLSFLTHHVAPVLARPTLVAGLAGGALCLIWGLRAIKGSRGKALPILTLIPVAYVMLSQSVTVWSGEGEAIPGRGLAAFVITTLFVLSVGMLLRLTSAGLVVHGQPTSSMEDGGTKPQAPGNPTSQASAVKRA